ncbi:hypothetical protein TTHERM_00497650 (macronuclear) [Tetrahymena thermophila SB210]|uniref:Uncharacterized protein n=1 Tax=Tetrahymena thermophila (strain SB210) TaxID=312017 RepID=I7MB60_TETTS|nr:hypothetical protein TTHERM_00497650 [Tetrahymena thermophila SB210]EAS07711.1 hypothetical protein TTHERM_00497650 [Tetrahymena thermophila SB210]|eukprot:XP_001027953.1 hypothetical protein TTHERM_00497650 [Tetrahymena thermophila SB210]
MIEEEDFKQYQSHFQQDTEFNSLPQYLSNSGEIINEDSQEPLIKKKSFDNEPYNALQSNLCQDFNINMNDLIFEKMKRIQLGTYRQEDFKQIDAMVQQKMQKNNQDAYQLGVKFQNSKDTPSLNSSSKLEWNDIDLVIQDDKSNQSDSKYQNQLQQYQKQNFKSHPVTHIFIKELQSTNIFYLMGNVIIDFKSGVYFNQNIQSNDFYNQAEQEESRVVNSAIKQIILIENNFKNQEISVHMQLNVKPLEDFSFITKFVQENSNTEISKQMGICLEFYQKSVAGQQKEFIRRAVLRAKELNYDFADLLQERQKILKIQHQDLLNEFQLNNTGFYCASHYCADFNSEDLTLQNFSYSYPLIALLGLEPSQFQSGVSKKGISMWISPYTRSLIQISALKDWFSIQKGERFSVDKIDPFCLKTLDEMVVVTKAKKIRKLVRYEGPLSYIFEGIADSVNMIVLDVDLFTIKRIISMRKDYILNQKAAQFIDDFEYNIQSQIFLEKYYSNQYDDYIAEQQKIQKINEKKQIDDSKVCSYRYIN